MSDTREFIDDYFPISFGEYSVKITYAEDIDDVMILSCEVDLDLDGEIKAHIKDVKALESLKPELIKKLKEQALPYKEVA